MSGSTPLRRSIIQRLVVQTCLLTTFVIVVLSTVSFMLAESILKDVVSVTGVLNDNALGAIGPGLVVLRYSLTLVGALLVGFAAATAFLLARQVTNPLRNLTAKVGSLRAGDASARTVNTGDEVETLDEVFVHMAGRLAEVYAHQEDEIAKRMEDLRHQYQLDHVILDSIHLGVMTVDRSGLVMLGNPAALALLQQSEVVGKKIEDVLLLRGHGGSPIPGRHAVLECLDTSKPFRTSPTAHWSLERSDRGFQPITLSVVPLQDNNASYGALVMFQNVSEERHIDYLKSEFITLASHQLRTPLSAIRWYAELLVDAAAGFNSDQRDYIEEIDKSVRRMITLLGSLLHAARIEDEAVRPTLIDANLATMVPEAVCECEDVFVGSQVRSAIIVPPTEVIVRTDTVLLRVVLQNLLSNAAKYSPKGSTVTVRLVVENGSAIITVEDTGIGIPKADQERIFEKFFRAQNVRQIDTDGNGLGLYISRSILERLGGSMSFSSEEHTGTTFTVSLPLLKKI